MLRIVAESLICNLTLSDPSNFTTVARSQLAMPSTCLHSIISTIGHYPTSLIRALQVLECGERPFS